MRATGQERPVAGCLSTGSYKRIADTPVQASETRHRKLQQTSWQNQVPAEQFGSQSDIISVGESAFVSNDKIARAMLEQISRAHWEQLAQTAKTNAIAGAVAGVALGVIHGAVSVRRSQLRDGYEFAAEGLTLVSTGAILGLLSGTTAALAGVTTAAVAGRGILALAVPLVASNLATGFAREPVNRLARTWSEGVVKAGTGHRSLGRVQT